MLKIENLFYSPVKSISLTESITLNIIKDRGIENDRIFAFTQNLDTLQIKNLEQKPHLRKLNNFITLKNSPELNQYNFLLNKDQLILKKSSEEIIKINPYAKDERVLLLNQISKLIKKEKKIDFVIDQKNPFFDTMPSNSISLINKNSINDFEKKINTEIEIERFRANIYINGLKAWEERTWIGKIIEINNIKFSVTKEISRCSATNLQPNTDNVTINLPNQLKKTYDHIYMGLYLTPLSNGDINIDNELRIYD